MMIAEPQAAPFLVYSGWGVWRQSKIGPIFLFLGKGFSFSVSGWNISFLLVQAFCRPTFPLDQLHLQRETWETIDVPSVHNAVSAASNLMPEKKKKNTHTSYSFYKINDLIIHGSYFLSNRGIIEPIIIISA